MLIGIVGKPNVGKSTFFKAITLAEVEIASYPFATIKPNHGIGYVRVNCAEGFFKVKCNPREGFCIDGQRFVPVSLIDVAGLVPGAHEGKGMGNQFLDELRQADALIHVIDASGSTSESGNSVPAGSYDPAEDVRFLEAELDQWYLSILRKPRTKFARSIVAEKRNAAAAIAQQFSGLKASEETIKEIIAQLQLDAGNPAAWNEEQLLQFATELRRKTKPMIIAANKADIPEARGNIARLQQQFPGYRIVPCSAESELALREAARRGLAAYIPGDSEFAVTGNAALTQQQRQGLDVIRKSVLQQYGSTGVQQALDTAVFKLLGCIPVFPVALSSLQDKDGNVLPDCLLLLPQSTAFDLASHVHTDLARGFIRAIDVKTKRTVGRDHELQAGDVIEIVTR